MSDPPDHSDGGPARSTCFTTAACLTLSQQSQAGRADANGGAYAFERVDHAPVPTKTGRITGESFRDALWTMMVDDSTAAYIPERFRHAEGGNEDLIRRFVGEFDDSGYFNG